jgi:glycine betaine/proline transport system substrate-binding protein
MKKLVFAVFALLLISALVLTPSLTQADDKEIVLVENPWTASSLNVNVAKILLEAELGYEVEIILLDESAQWAAIGAGDAHASLEVWPSGHAENVKQYIDELEVVVNGGELGPVGKIGWYIPSYLLESNPDLATWEGFTDPEAAALFATAETGDKGQFLAGAPGWVEYDAQIIANLDLNLEVIHAGSEEAILAAVEAAYNREEPILFYFWTPHSIHAKYELTEVELPAYSEDCYAGVADGEIDGVACDYPEDALFKIFWADLEEEMPEAFEFLSNFTYSNDDQIAMIAAVELDGLTVEEAAQAWVDENEAIWSEWLPE